MNTIADFLIKRKRNIGHWEGIAEEWILAIERFSRITNGDASYWYNERANVGVLSAAAWRCGLVALEEFQHEKVDVSASGETDEQALKTWNGRCDLWICGDKKSELVEAKFHWINMLSKQISELAANYLDIAVCDAVNTRGTDDIDAIGVAFLPVYVKENKINDSMTLEDIIEQTIEAVQKIDADLVAWCFPKRLRKHVGEQYGNYLPGIIMLARKVV